MGAVLQTGTSRSAVNGASVARETRAELAHMIYLAEKLGLFQARYTVGRPASIEIEYRGDLGITDTYPILSAILMGFLAPKVETVNTVSAPSLLRDHGIVSSETRSPEASDYGFQINVTVVTDQETVTVAGTLLGDDDPRICSIDGTRIDAVPEGWIVICMNDDKPLVLGKITTIIGEAKVNIANLTLGRDVPGGHATTLINLDAPLKEETIEKIRQLPHVNRVRLVHL